MLSLLYKNRNTVVSRDTILDEGWGAHIMPDSRTLDQHIAILRKKIETDTKNPEIIKTIHGVGYRYQEK